MKNSRRIQYEWTQSFMGGGGYITGILQNPINTEVIYARCDVAGIFKSVDRGESWRPINNGMRLCHHHSVQSFALSPHNPDVLFRCSGDARGQRIFGTIHKSVNGGQSWYEVCEDVDFYGNGPTRMFGEVIQVHPGRPEFVVAGGYSNGVWISSDEGETWRYSGLKDERITCVCIHPCNEEVIYAVSTGDTGLAALNKYDIASYHDYPRSPKGRFYCSKDCGQSWELLYEGFNFCQLEFDKTGETIFAACMEEGLQKSCDGGRTWHAINVGLPEQFKYKVIESDPFDPYVLYTIPGFSGRPEGLDPIPVYKSHDRGETWKLVKKHSVDDITKYPRYITLQHIGWAVSKLLVDLKKPDRMYMSNWYGVSVSNDAGKSWCGNEFKGMETICGESIVCDPVMPGKLYITLADHSPGVSTDHGEKYSNLPHKPPLNNSTALTVSRNNNDIIIYGARNRHGNRECSIIKSEDGGKTIRVVKVLEPGLFIQGLAEDYFKQGVFYSYVDGEIEKGAGLYRTADWGETWKKINFRLPGYIRALPHEQEWLDAELLSVVIYQVKNVCGSNQLLRTDPHKPDTLFIGERTEGIFMTADGGRTWSNIGIDLPFKANRASVLNTILMDENRPGVIYAGFIREGLWVSKDYGLKWKKLLPKCGKVFNATSVALGGKEGEIFIACEPLYWSACESSVWYSFDGGENWTDIHDKKLGALRWKGIAVEKDTGIVHGITCGNGCFYAKRKA